MSTIAKDPEPPSGPPAGAGRLDESERVDRRVSDVVRLAGRGTSNLQKDLPEQAAKDSRRLRGASLQELLQIGDPLAAPLLGGNLEDRAFAALQGVKLDPDLRHPSLGEEVLAAVRALAAPGPRVDRVLAALEDGALPSIVHTMLRRALQESLASGTAVEPALDRAAMAVDLPWRTHAPARFDGIRLREALDRTHAGLDRAKSRLVEVLRRAGGRVASSRWKPRPAAQRTTYGRRWSCARGHPERDQYLKVPFNLSAVLWIATATDPAAIPEPVRDRLEGAGGRVSRHGTGRRPRRADHAPGIIC